MGQLWHGQTVWRVLDTEFGVGGTFLDAWRAWRQDPHRPQTLHHVALCEAACRQEDIEAVGRARPQLAHFANELAGQWWGVLPGFHRFLFDQGRVTLTLCVGPILPMLRAQQFEADELVYWHSTSLAADLSWVLKALTRCCRRHTVLRLVPEPHPAVRADHAAIVHALGRAGFGLVSHEAPELPDEPVEQLFQFDPPWQIKTSRRAMRSLPVLPGRCVVIGAGLAGASVAASLARRGWQVVVLDQADAPAAGASGLPVGLVVPHVSRDDCVLSRLSRNGVRLMLQQVQELLVMGKDWGPSGVLERQIDAQPQLPLDWPAEGLVWSHGAANAASPHIADSLWPGLWHAHGAWIKPAQLVKAWLAQAGITFQGQAKVAAVRRINDTWHVLNDTGESIASADQVVLANAGGAFELLSELLLEQMHIQGLQPNLIKTQGMRGLLSWSLDAEATNTSDDHGFPAFPVNGSGSLIPAIPLAQGTGWFMGSSYQEATEPERSDLANHAINLAHLQQLLPEVATRLAPAFECGQVSAWKSVRCVTVDRLPVVGPLQVDGQTGLWLCAGLGSRGLSFSALCAELLAARMGGEPWPVEGKLANALDTMRGKQPLD